MTSRRYQAHQIDHGALEKNPGSKQNSLDNKIIPPTIVFSFKEYYARAKEELFDLRYYLEKKLKCKVDLGTPQSLHPRLKDGILKEAVRVA